MSLVKHKQDWEDLGAVDACWAICSQPDRKNGRWDVEDFFRTGSEDVAGVMEVANRLRRPTGRDRALDFGCGVGRLTRALGTHFGHCTGVDISESMIAQAQELNRQYHNCEFHVNVVDNLQRFPDDHFDMVYSKWVLQHLPTTDLIRSYLREFVRVMKKDALLTFQLRVGLSFRTRLQLWRRLYNLLRAGGLSEQFLFKKLGLHPMRMTAIPEAEVTALLRECGARVLEMQEYSVSSGQGRVYYVTK
jgi:SAM-dependent methyltransferase